MSHIQHLNKAIKDLNRLLEDQVGFVNPPEKMLTEKITGIDLSGYDVLVIGESPSLTIVEEIHSTEIPKTTKVSENEYLLEIHFDTFCSIESFIFKSELAAISEDDLGETSISNSNFNEHYASAETEMGLKIDIETIFNVDKKGFSILFLDRGNHR